MSTSSWVLSTQEHSLLGMRMFSYEKMINHQSLTLQAKSWRSNHSPKLLHAVTMWVSFQSVMGTYPQAFIKRDKTGSKWDMDPLSWTNRHDNSVLALSYLPPVQPRPNIKTESPLDLSWRTRNFRNSLTRIWKVLKLWLGKIWQLMSLPLKFCLLWMCRPSSLTFVHRLASLANLRNSQWESEATSTLTKFIRRSAQSKNSVSSKNKMSQVKSCRSQLVQSQRILAQVHPVMLKHPNKKKPWW